MGLDLKCYLGLNHAEKKQEDHQPSTRKKKRKPGGQPGHEGKTRKGFERVDRYEELTVSHCRYCGQEFKEAKPEKIETQQVAQLVAKPIEIVEAQRHHQRCDCCQKLTAADWSNQIIPGQDLGIKIQALLGWLGNYGHLPYEKQQEQRRELGKIEVGVGTLVATNQRIGAAINNSVTDLQEWINLLHPPLHIDETPWPAYGYKRMVMGFHPPKFLSVSSWRHPLSNRSFRTTWTTVSRNHYQR